MSPVILKAFGSCPTSKRGTLSSVKSKASTATQMSTALFWVVTKRVVPRIAQFAVLR